MSRGRKRKLAGLVLAFLIFGTGAAIAKFSSFQTNPQTVTAVNDFIPPAPTAVIGKTEGGSPGYVRAGGTYRVYANATDSGNPASGIASVGPTDISALGGSASAALTGGSFTFNGTSYAYQSALQTVAAGTTAGSKSYSVATADSAGNSGSTNFSVTVDNTAPTGTDVQTANGGVAGKPDTGDTITYTFSEPIEPASILAGWAGASQAVTVRINNSGANDPVLIYNAANTTQLPLGTISMGANFATTALTFTATMVISGSTLTVTLGTTGGNPKTSTTAVAMSWATGTPAGAYDRAANPLSGSTVAESGTADVDF